MAFSWDKCTVIRQRSNPYRVDWFRCIDKFKDCLTPNVRKGLEIWLSNKMKRYNSGKFTNADVIADISELLTKCCGVSRVALIMRSDVESAEAEIIQQLKYAIDVAKYNGLYTEELPQETIYEFNKRQILTVEDVEEYLKGVPIYAD